MPPPAIGIAVSPMEARHDALLEIADLTERHGYDGLYVAEGWGHDVAVVLGELAARTRRIRLGAGIFGVWSRSPAAVAMAAATLHLASGGRFVLGLGASSAQLTEGLHDVPFREPVARLRLAITQVRALLRGERVPLAVTTGARALRLGIPPAPDLPIHLAALAPASIRLAGELADGWLPFLYPRDRLDQGRALLEEGAARAGRAGRPLAVVPSVPVVVDEDAGRAREGAAWFVAFYLVSMGELYRRILGRLGFQREVDAVLAANDGRAPTLVPAEAEPLLEQLVIHGTPAEARQRLAAWQAAGVSGVALLLRPGLSREELARTVEALRPAAPPEPAAR